MNSKRLSAGVLFLAATCSIRAQKLSDLIAEAEHNNAQILARQHRWQAATHLRQQVTTLPDPQFTVQEFSVGSPMPFARFNSSDFAYIGVGASQELPYPGKLRLKGEAADRTADVQEAQMAVARASVVDALKAAYLKLAYLQQTLPLLEASRNTLSQIIEGELARYRTGSGSQADVLKAQLKRTNLIREITIHHQNMAEVQADLKRLLHRPQESPDIVAQELTVTKLQYTSRELLDLARGQNPELKVETSTVAMQNAELRSAERAAKPDFSVGYMYERTGNGFPAYYMLTFNVILPRRERVRAKVAEAAESLKAASEQFDSQIQDQLAEVQKQYAAANATAEMLTEYREGMLPQAEAGFRAVLAQYQSNKEQLDAVLNGVNQVLALKREYEQTLLDHETAISKLETLTGAVLR